MPSQLQQRDDFGIDRAVVDAKHSNIDGVCTAGHGKCCPVNLQTINLWEQTHEKVSMSTNGIVHQNERLSTDCESSVSACFPKRIARC